MDRERGRLLQLRMIDWLPGANQCQFPGPTSAIRTWPRHSGRGCRVVAVVMAELVVLLRSAVAWTRKISVESTKLLQLMEITFNLFVNINFVKEKYSR